MDKTMEIRFNLYDGSKSGLTTLKMYDAWALQDIKRAEAAIAEAKKYRLELAKRAAALTSQTTHTRVTLRREKSYKGKVYYYLVTYEVYEDGTEIINDSKKFTGSERHTAIKEFREIQKEHPHYECVEDIKKGAWE